MMPIIRLKNQGFSLIELAVVILIIGILLFATLSVGSSQLDISRIKATQDKLTKIQTALDIFYKTNNYLPCPANATQPVSAIGSTGFGVGQKSADASGTSTATCSNVFRDGPTTIYVGVAPVRDLNLPDEFAFDSWGGRITYIVSKNCIDQDNWLSTNTYKCSDGATTTANGGKLPITGQNNTSWASSGGLLAAYALISHGKNGIGAWDRSGVKVGGVPTNTTAEKNNGNLDPTTGAALTPTAMQTTAYWDKAIYDGSATNYFDDIIRWKTAPQIDYDANH